MKKQILSAGTRLLLNEENNEIAVNAILHLLLCGIDATDIKGMKTDMLQKLQTTGYERDKVAAFLSSNRHNRFIWHATITLLLMKGTSIDVLCPACGFSRSTVFGWQKKVLESGWNSLMPKDIPGCPSKLSDEQIREIKNDLFLFRDKPHGKKLAVYIYKKFGVKLTERYCQSLYKRLDREIGLPYGQINLLYEFSDLYDDVKEWMANCNAIYKEINFSK